jgi:hypothetical protein
MSLKCSTPCTAIAIRSSPYVSSTDTGDSSIPPACWKYVNCVISSPSSHTCHPTPDAPSVGASQSSSMNRMSCSFGSNPSARRLSRYTPCTSVGDGFRIT